MASKARMIFQITSQKYDQAVKLAVDTLQKGEPIALPTDTIYGIACLAERRDLNKPVSICVADISDMYK
jgi:tRNA A37 threonylcarbamoyladenosine synthetase subunit TsaC/SUA5/YrdC